MHAHFCQDIACRGGGGGVGFAQLCASHLRVSSASNGRGHRCLKQASPPAPCCSPLGTLIHALTLPQPAPTVVVARRLICKDVRHREERARGWPSLRDAMEEREGEGGRVGRQLRYMMCCVQARRRQGQRERGAWGHRSKLSAGARPHLHLPLHALSQCQQSRHAELSLWHLILRAQRECGSW